MSTISNTGIIIVGHGSPNLIANQQFIALADRFKRINKEFEVTHAFLENQKPGFGEGVEALLNKGISDIIVLPAFLFTGLHVSHDIPLLFKQIKERYSHLSIRMAREIGYAEPLFKLLESRIANLIAQGNEMHGTVNQTVILVSVGASVPMAVNDFKRVINRLEEKFMAVKFQEAYIGRQVYPEYSEALANVIQAGTDDIVVQPVLLFGGYYYDTIRKISASAIMKYNRSIMVGDVLSSEPEIGLVLKNRLQEVLNGDIDLIEALPESAEARRNF